ncbi:LytR C-terminal domain-containing protein [Sphingomonas koreensis]
MTAARPLLLALAMFGLLNGCATSRGLSGIRPVGGVAVGQTSVAAGNALVERGQYGLAVAAYRRVLRLDPANSQALEGLAITYELLGRADLADRYYQEALALAPHNPRIYQNFAGFLRAQRRDADAEQLQADMRIALPEAESEVAAAPVEAPPPRTHVIPVELAAAAPMEPDVRLIRQSDRATLVVTMPRPAVAPATALVTAEASASAPMRGLRPLRVVNAVGRHGVARQTAALLAKDGFTGVETGDAAFKLKRSRILVPVHNRELGERLSRSLPFAARIEESVRVDRVQILIGADAVAALMRARRA